MQRRMDPGGHAAVVDDMQVLQGIEGARFSRSVLTIGNFDGVHRGHQALLSRGREISRLSGAPLVVMTFEPHPAVILTPDRVPPTLTPLHEKLRLLQQAGASATVLVESRLEFFQASAEEFIRDIIARFRPHAMVEGESFRFGRHRQGDIQMLRTAGSANGFEVHTVEPVRVDLGGHPDTVISSSLIRHLISSGNVDRAALCLGRPYALFGRVLRGAGRGRTLGFPTANLSVEDQLVPPEGVYAGLACVGARSKQLTFPAAISIGRTPTFAAQDVVIEAHLLDFHGDLYDQPLRLEFLDWIREQQRFSSAEALREQIERDVARVREAAVG